MAVESATTIAGLNALWPPGTDAKQEGDNHIRLIKSVLKADAVSKAELTAAMPVGAVMDYAGASAPTGWLLCFGQAVNRTTYSALFTAIGTAFGVGDGSTTFNLPDLRGRVVAAPDNMGGAAASRLPSWVLGTAGGLYNHVLTEAELASHLHGATANTTGGHQHTYNDTSVAPPGPGLAGGANATNVATGLATGFAGDHTHTITVVAAGSNAAHNNVQPTIALNKIIKT